jgi:LmbE family N-acetylglucosaminyl deacetylase
MEGMRTYRFFGRSGWIHWVAGVACLCAVLAGVAKGIEADPLLLGDEEDRLLVLAPHPDDEVIGAGGLIQEAVELGVPVKVCFLTMGDNNELAFLFVRKHPVVMPGAVRRMGETRCAEAKEAARRMDLDPERDVVFLGYPDFGTLRIWNDHWRDVAPLRSMLTRATAVPYAEARTPGAAYAGEDVLEDLTEVIREFRPTHVALPTAADHNVDHRALYLFARVALWNLEAEGIAPERLAYPVHYPRWPSPRRYHPELEAEPPEFLANSDEIGWLAYSLAPYQVTNKLNAIRAHRSQCLYSAGYLESFARGSEWFGDFDDLRLPGAVGREELGDGDTGAYAQDDGFLEELAEQDAAWKQIADQQDAEEAAAGDAADLDFLDRRVSCDGNELTLVCRFSGPVPPRARASFRFCGWRPDAAFGEMPKIHVRMSSRKVKKVTDLNRMLDPAEVSVPDGLFGNEIGITVPLDLLGRPEKLLVAASVSSGEMPLDWAAWRVVDFAAPGGLETASARPGAGSVPSLRLTPRVRASAPAQGGAAAVAPAEPSEAAVRGAKKEPAKAAESAVQRRVRSSPLTGSADDPVVW